MKENFKITLCILIVFVSSFIVLGLFLEGYSQGILTSEKNIIDIGGIVTQNPKQVTLDFLSEIFGETQMDDVKVNSLGFRGEEFSEIKPKETYRIFLIGGSQMFGTGATSDITTIPGYLNQYIEQQNYAFSIEVINAGLKGVDSHKELLLLQNMIIDFSPDMVIVYDGLNDLRIGNSPDNLLNNWEGMCSMGKENNFDVIVSIQPIAGFGNKNLTQKEKMYVENGKDYNNNPLTDSWNLYQKYAENLKKLQKCTEEIDFRFAFDNETDTIYIDEAHVSDHGNAIIANSIFTKISDIIPKEINPESRTIEFNKKDRSIISEFQSSINILSSNFEDKMKLQVFKTFMDNNLEKESQTGKFNVKTQSLFYEDIEIEVIIEILPKDEFSEIKNMRITTKDKNKGTVLNNITYLMTITKNDNKLFTNYFFAEDQLIIQLNHDDSENIKISGERRYGLDALIMNSENPISISGSFLESNSKYEFDISLRSIHDVNNFIFLDGFYAKIST